MPDASAGDVHSRRVFACLETNDDQGRTSMSFLSQQELEQLASAETEAFASPIPTQVVSSDEYMPIAQTEKQKKVEARMKELGDENARKNGMDRRQFFQTAAGMATAFAAMNDVFGPLYNVGKA